MSHLPDHERRFVEFMQSDQNLLGWRPLGRDEKGRAVAITELPLPAKPGATRVCRVTLDAGGLIHHATQIVGG